MTSNYKMLATLLTFALLFYTVGTLDETMRIIFVLALAAIIYGIWNRR